MDGAEREALGLAEPVRLPRTIGAARAALLADGGMRAMLGDEFVETYVKVNEVRRSDPSVSLRCSASADGSWRGVGRTVADPGDVHAGRGRERDGAQAGGVLLRYETEKSCNIITCPAPPSS